MSDTRQLRFFTATHQGGTTFFPGGHAQASPPLAPRPLRPSQPFCTGCLRLIDECHCAPALNQDGSLRVNVAPTPPRQGAAVDALKCKGCGRITGCRCGTSAGDLGARIDAQIKMNRQRG